MPALPLQTIGIVTRIAVIALALALISEKSEIIRSLTVFGDRDWRQLLGPVPEFWLGLLAPGFYLCALWSAGSVFFKVDKGEAFSPLAVKALNDVGSNLMLGAVSAVVIAPSLLIWLSDRFRGVRFDFDIPSVTIGLIGLMLTLLAAQGRKLREDMESFV